MCIYERVAMMGIGGAAIIGLIAPQNGVVRWLGLAAWGYSSYRGLSLALEHVDTSSTHHHLQPVICLFASQNGTTEQMGALDV